MAAKLLQPGPEGRQRIDRYELVAEIASGGMATVFLARLGGVGGFQRFVAIKRLHPHLASEEEFVEMFLDEARLAAGIHHPNVVPILEVGASERGYYIVMEYIEGDTLARLLARSASSGRTLPASIGIRIILDMLAGLHAAHELRDHMGNPTELVHRDVSPQNVLVGIDGIARITDFGVARAASRLSATRVGQLKGKIAYMAPEQASAQPTVDRRADIFSAGIVVWEVLAARRLFKSDNDAATLSRIISEPIPPLMGLNPQISAQVNEVVMKALERDPGKRYPTCARFADALERAAGIGGKVASSRELAAYVAEVFGAEIAAQRDAVRAWLARSEPSEPRQRTLVGMGSTVSAGAMALPGSGGVPVPDVTASATVSYPRKRSLLGPVIAFLLIGGAAGFAYYVLQPQANTPPATAAPSPTPADPPPRATNSAAAPSAEPSAVASAAPSASSSAPVAATPAPPVQRAGRGKKNPAEEKPREDPATTSNDGESGQKGRRRPRQDEVVIPDNPYR